MKRLAVCAVTLSLPLTLAGCGPHKSVSISGSSPPASSLASPSSSSGGVQVLESGFVPTSNGTWVTALLKNNTGSRGQAVTLSFNLYSGSTLVKSDSQVDAFDRVGDTVAVGTSADVGKTKITRATFSVSLEAGDNDSDPSTVIPVSDVTITKDQYGAVVVGATLQNTTAAPLKSPEVGIICTDAQGKVDAGGVDFPEVIPAHSSYRDTGASLFYRGKPAHCVVTAQAGALGF
jgi:hypothetical protein